MKLVKLLDVCFCVGDMIYWLLVVDGVEMIDVLIVDDINFFFGCFVGVSIILIDMWVFIWYDFFFLE